MLLAQNVEPPMNSNPNTVLSTNPDPFLLEGGDSEDEDLYGAPQEVELHSKMDLGERREKNGRSTNMAAASSRQYGTLGRVREPPAVQPEMGAGSTMSLDRHRKLVPTSEMYLSLNNDKKSENTKKDIPTSNPDSDKNVTADKRDHFDFVSDLITQAKSPTSPTKPLPQSVTAERSKPSSKGTASRGAKTKVSGDVGTRTTATKTTRVHGTKASALGKESTSSRATRSKSHEKEIKQPKQSMDVELSHSPTFWALTFHLLTNEKKVNNHSYSMSFCKT